MKELCYYDALAIVETTLKAGGYSHKEYTSGYMVSLDGTEVIIALYDNDRFDIAYKIKEFYSKHGTVNTWLDDGKIYLDVSVNIKGLDEAIKFGKENNQLAIYDCKAKKVIEL